METQTYPKSTDHVGFLHLKSYWLSVDSVLVLNMHYQHGPVTGIVLAAQSTVCVCVAHGSLSPPRLDRLMMEVCVDIHLIVHSSCWFADVEWVFVTCGCVVPFQVTNNNEVGLCCELLFVD